MIEKNRLIFEENISLRKKITDLENSLNEAETPNFHNPISVNIEKDSFYYLHSSILDSENSFCNKTFIDFFDTPQFGLKNQDKKGFFESSKNFLDLALFSTISSLNF